MLISFIGAPCSGKTTVAAMVFASLKDAGQLAEFVPEQARMYIAGKKLVRHQMQALVDPQVGPVWSFPVDLTDEDQIEIAICQSKADELMLLSSGPGATVVSDSSPVNSLFYMSEAGQIAASCTDIIQRAVKETAVFFYVKPISIQSMAVLDPNRLHDMKFSKELDDRIVPLLTGYFPEISKKIVPLIGSAEERKIQALTVYYHLKYPRPQE